MAVLDGMTRFWRDRGGNFAMMMGIAILPAIAAVGLAVDFTNLARMKSNLQNANDSAVLFASRYHQVNGKLPPKGEVENFLKTNYRETVDDARLYVADGNIWLETKSSHEPYFMGLFSAKMAEVAVTSAAPVGKELDLEIVLSLDTTYSMLADGKMAGLKVAAANFINTLFSVSNKQNRVKIGLVPFGKYVNVGLHNRNASWMSVPEDISITGERKCDWRPKKIGETNCRMVTAYRDGVPYQYKKCDPIYSSEKEEVCWTPKKAEVWYGCVGSRQDPDTKKPLNLVDAEPKIPFPGIMQSRSECGSPIAPLTNKKDALLKQVAAFKPEGNTYIVDGVMWGLRVLSPQVPFTEGVDPKKVSNEVRKIMILMTDGENTISNNLPHAPTHNGGDRNLTDDQTEKACRETKKNGVEIFTITFGKEVPGHAKRLMERCAASPDHYFDAADSAKLDEAFRAIAGLLTRVRLTH